MGEGWLTAEHKLIEALLKQALAQQLQGFLDPCDLGSAYDCTILVPQRFELKYDKKAATTGNLYFETTNTYQGRPSGLGVTEADFWAHYLPHLQRIALFRPDKMLAFLQQQLDARRPGFRQTRPGGGDNNSQGIVAPIADILAQPFVTAIVFRVELPRTRLDLSGVLWRCVQCHRISAVEALQMGYCQPCLEREPPPPRPAPRREADPGSPSAT
jgi:hypothetical protein